MFVFNNNNKNVLIYLDLKESSELFLGDRSICDDFKSGNFVCQFFRKLSYEKREREREKKKKINEINYK